jgi:hypothetical protein
VFTGRFQVVGEHGSFSGACWSDIARQGSSAGKPYLSLVLEPLGPDGKPYKLRGWMFEAEIRTQAKSCDFFGRLKLSNEPTGPTMRVAAWRRQAGQYLSILIEPPS